MFVENYSLLISRAFWTLFTVEAIACAVLIFWTSGPARGWGPEGPVGAWLVYLVPPIMLGVPLAVVLMGRSKYATLAGLIYLCWPLVPLVIGPIYSVLDNSWTDHGIAGDFNFFRPSQRQLAHALRAHDAALVTTLLPRAGDLNVDHWGESLFSFALKNLDKTPASVEIVKAMLDRGANPNLEISRNYWPLIAAISAGPETSKLLLDAGADPNRIDDGTPIWWSVLYDDSIPAQQTLTLLLDHGADMTKRDSYNGPVGRAAYLKNWRAVWLLIERGVAWKDERAFDQPIPDILLQDFKSRRFNNFEIPEEMAKIMAKYGVQPPTP